MPIYMLELNTYYIVEENETCYIAEEKKRRGGGGGLWKSIFNGRLEDN